MNATILHALAQYNGYANKTLVETAAKLSLEELSAASSPSRQSALILIYHLLNTEAHFLAQCQGRVFQFDLQAVTTIKQLSAFAEQHTQDLLTFVVSLDEVACEREINVEIGITSFDFWSGRFSPKSLCIRPNIAANCRSCFRGLASHCR